MHPGGYGGDAFKGSVKSGFKKRVFSPQFAADLAKTPPLPDGRDFETIQLEEGFRMELIDPLINGGMLLLR